MTAVAVHSTQSTPQPPLTTSHLLREQHFGIAEGKHWVASANPTKTLAEHYAEGVYPTLPGRMQKFPEGESLDDLGHRADQAINELVMPHVWKAARDGRKGVHVAVVSHGLCINEVDPATYYPSRNSRVFPADTNAAQEGREGRRD